MPVCRHFRPPAAVPHQRGRPRVPPGLWRSPIAVLACRVRRPHRFAPAARPPRPRRARARCSFPAPIALTDVGRRRCSLPLPVPVPRIVRRRNPVRKQTRPLPTARSARLALQLEPARLIRGYRWRRRRPGGPACGPCPIGPARRPGTRACPQWQAGRSIRPLPQNPRRCLTRP